MTQCARRVCCRRRRFNLVDVVGSDTLRQSKEERERASGVHETERERGYAHPVYAAPSMSPSSALLLLLRRRRRRCHCCRRDDARKPTSSCVTRRWRRTTTISGTRYNNNDNNNGRGTGGGGEEVGASAPSPRAR